MTPTSKKLRTLEARKHERGVAMFVAVMLLALLGAMGIASMQSVNRDRQVAGFQNRSNNAFYAAEAGAAHARNLVRNNAQDRGSVINLPNTNLGDAAMYNFETQLPQYYADPAVAAVNPTGITYQGDGGDSEGMQEQEGNIKFVDTLWRINVVGQSPSAVGVGNVDSRGSTARIEVIQSKVMAGGASYN